MAYHGESATTRPSIPSDAISSVNERIDQATISLCNVTVAIHQHANSILGPEPPTTSPGSKLEGAPTNTRDFLTRLETQLSELGMAINRLGLSS